MKTDGNNRSHSSANIRPTCVEAPRTTTAAMVPSKFQLKKILIPLDFSECSQKAIHYAVSFAGQFQVQMIFLHILPVNYSALIEPKPSGSGPVIRGETWRKLEARLAEVVRENVPAGISAESLVRYGAPALEIMNVAGEFEVDMIIMATHGLTGRAHSLLGSVAGDVARLAPCPVLIVHPQERKFTEVCDPRHANPVTPSTWTTTGTP